MLIFNPAILVIFVFRATVGSFLNLSIGHYLIHDPWELVPSPLSALLGILIGGGFLLAPPWACEVFTSVEGMGGGDIKLLAMIGAFMSRPSSSGIVAKDRV